MINNLTATTESSWWRFRLCRLIYFYLLPVIIINTSVSAFHHYHPSVQDLSSRYHRRPSLNRFSSSSSSSSSQSKSCSLVLHDVTGYYDDAVLNSAIDTSVAASTTAAAAGGDSTLLIGLGVATIAVVGLAALQLPKILDESEQQQQPISTKEKPMTPQAPEIPPPESAFKRAVQEVKKTATATTSTSTQTPAAEPSKDNTKQKDSSIRPVPPPSPSAVKTAVEETKIDQNISEKNQSGGSFNDDDDDDDGNQVGAVNTDDAATSSSLFNKEEDDDDEESSGFGTQKKSLFLYLSGDDLDREERRAKKAMDTGNKILISKSFGRMSRLVRKARIETRNELASKQKLESKLEEMVEEIRTVEDQFELEQNQLMKVKKDLSQTKNELTSTQQSLNTAKVSIQQLEDDKQSIRKLSKEALGLMKRRVGNVFRRRKGRDEKQDGR